MRKRLVSVILGTMMVVSLVGCSKEATVSNGNVNSEMQQSDTEKTSEDGSFEIIYPVETPNGEETEKQTETAAPEVTTKPVETQKPEETTQPVESVKGTNQLTDEMNEKVEVFKYLTDLEKKPTTRTVEVGGKIGISGWQNATLYSQDTGIASVDGMIVTGVSEGTTYVVVESSLGATQVYCIVVKGISSSNEQVDVNIQKGTNQLTPKMNEEVEVFKYLTELEQRPLTRTIEVGGKVGIGGYQNATLYSQDTGIASVDGMIVSGVSKGTTYVVVESSLGLRQVYKIIVK